MNNKLQHNPYLSIPDLRIWHALGWITTSLYIIFIVLPLLALLVRGLQQESFLSSVISNTAFQAIKVSLVTSGASMLVIVIVCTPFAHLLARNDSGFLKQIDTLVELPIVLPPVVAGVAMLMAFGRNGLLGNALTELGISIPFTIIAVIFAQIFVAAPFYIRSAKLGFQAIPISYQEVSQTLGMSPWKTFWLMTFPLARTPILTGLILAWARALSEFGATIMFAGNLMGKTQTLPLAIMTTMESSLDTALALSVLLFIGATLILIISSFITHRRWQ